MTTLHTAAQQALDLLVVSCVDDYIDQAIAGHIESWGESYKPARLAGMRGDKERVAKAVEALRETLAQPQAQPEPVAWLIEYECRAGGMNRGGSLTKFDYVWHPHSFVSVDRDATIDAETVRNKKLTPLYAAPRPPIAQPVQQEKSCATCITLLPGVGCYGCVPNGYSNWRAK